MKIKKPPFDHSRFLGDLRRFLPCDHPCAVPRKKIKERSGQPYFRRQCPDCGKPLSSQLRFDFVEDYIRNHGEIEDWDFAHEQAWLEKRLSLGEYFRNEQNGKRHAEWWRQYDEYRESSEWKEIRQRILDRCDHICEICRVAVATQAHHLCYDRVGEELLSDLQGVCRPCHEVIHPDMSTFT